MPDRNSLNYRYAFQGQELDGETGMEAFQLRLWDGRIGRWLSPDPMGQYDSPYLGMGNNPISMIDPDGGSTIDPPVKGGELKEVIITSHGKSSSGIMRGFSNFSQQFMASFSGFGNAFGSNMLLGAGRFDANNWSNSNSSTSYRVGQLGGEIASMVVGAGEMIVGGLAAAGGTVLIPVTGGASAAVAYGGAAVAAHGTAVAILGGVNTAADIRDSSDSFARKGHSNGGDVGNSEVPKGFKETTEFGRPHGQRVYNKGERYISPDVGQKTGKSHNGGVWKEFKRSGTKLIRTGTLDGNLNRIKD